MSTNGNQPRALLSATPESNAGTHRLSTGEEVYLPSHDELYAELTLRNRGLISRTEQEVLRQATILVAGCGAVGGATVEPLLRAGAEHFILAEPGTYEYNNANRQNMRIQDIGKNKAAAFAEKMPDINPYAAFEVHTDGITEANVADLVGRADLIIDGVDVTEPPALQAKFALHREAKRLRKPIIGGYDIAGAQWTPIYDYRKPGQKLLDGKISEADLPGLTPMAFLSKVISPLKIPIEMIPEIERQLIGQSASMPQLGYTALQFGVLVVRLAFDILMDRPVKKNAIIDVNAEVRSTRDRISLAGKRLAMLYIVNNRMKALRREGRMGVYSPLEDETFNDLKQYMQEQTWQPGEVIVRQGDPGDTFYVIVDGKVAVERGDSATDNGRKRLAELGNGDYFGEMALLSDEPRNATVTAISACTTLNLTRDAFERLLDSSRAAAKQIPKTAGDRQSG
ncbi:MAG TPA: ThiF family adenylyltransferase [Thermomicrobiales bacterium]|nr:ThiF family adenylyltransferase [Thermomicrobiales bacterium]